MTSRPSNRDNMRTPEFKTGTVGRATALAANKPDYGDPFDYPDIPPSNGLSEANYQAVMPDNVREAILRRRAGRPS